MKQILALISISIFLSACTHTFKHLNAKMVAADYKEIDRVTEPIGTELVTGKACTRSIVIIPIWISASINNAYADAASKVPEADGLKDVSIIHNEVGTVVYNEECYVVTGQPVRFRGKK